MRKKIGMAEKIKNLPAEECNVCFMIPNNRENMSSLARIKNKARHYFKYFPNKRQRVPEPVKV